MRSFYFCICLLGLLALGLPPKAAAVEWWETWEMYPQVPSVTPQMAKRIFDTHENVVLVYGGYESERYVVCGSDYIPVGVVPPHADGSKMVFNYPKDHWILVYCP